MILRLSELWLARTFDLIIVFDSVPCITDTVHASDHLQCLSVVGRIVRDTEIFPTRFLLALMVGPP